MSTYQSVEVAIGVLDYGCHEQNLLVADLRHGWIGGLVIASV